FRVLSQGPRVDRQHQCPLHEGRRIRNAGPAQSRPDLLALRGTEAHEAESRIEKAIPDLRALSRCEKSEPKFSSKARPSVLCNPVAALISRLLLALKTVSKPSSPLINMFDAERSKLRKPGGSKLPHSRAECAARSKPGASAQRAAPGLFFHDPFG